MRMLVSVFVQVADHAKPELAEPKTENCLVVNLGWKSI